MNEIVECCLIGGEWDYALRVIVASVDDYQSFQLDKLMTGGSEIAALRSTLIMRKVKHSSREAEILLENSGRGERRD